MAIYQGDTHVFLLSIPGTNGVAATVTTPPLVQIVSANSGLGVLGSAAAMTLIAGTQTVYVYAWSVGSTQLSGDYFAIVSYVANGVTVSNQLLERVQVGDTRITGVLAIDATVAKQSTVAKDATVAHVTDLVGISPNGSAVIQSILAQTTNIPVNPATQDLLLVLEALLTDIRDGILGSVIVNRSVNPKTLSILRVADASPVVTFTLTEDANSTSKLRQ